jgi:hypothetical protein
MIQTIQVTPFPAVRTVLSIVFFNKYSVGKPQ